MREPERRKRRPNPERLIPAHYREYVNHQTHISLGTMLTATLTVLAMLGGLVAYEMNERTDRSRWRGHIETQMAENYQQNTERDRRLELRVERIEKRTLEALDDNRRQTDQIGDEVRELNQKLNRWFGQHGTEEGE